MYIFLCRLLWINVSFSTNSNNNVRHISSYDISWWFCCTSIGRFTLDHFYAIHNHTSASVPRQIGRSVWLNACWWVKDLGPMWTVLIRRNSSCLYIFAGGIIEGTIFGSEKWPNQKNLCKNIHRWMCVQSDRNWQLQITLILSYLHITRRG
jgi:hypothetical protein